MGVVQLGRGLENRGKETSVHEEGGEGEKISSDQYPRGPGISGQPVAIAAARNEGPTAAVSLRRGGKAWQLPTL